MSYVNERGEIGVEWAVKLIRQRRDWVPVPDVLYVSYERLSPDWNEDEACPVVPELVIEIISAGQTFGQLAAKAKIPPKTAVETAATQTNSAFAESRSDGG